MEFIWEIFVKQIYVAVARRWTIMLKAEASLSQAEWQEERATKALHCSAVQSVKKKSSLQCRGARCDPDTDPGARSLAAAPLVLPVEQAAVYRLLHTGTVRAAALHRAAVQQQRLAPRRRRRRRSARARLAPNFPAASRQCLVSQALLCCWFPKPAVRTHQNRALQQSTIVLEHSRAKQRGAEPGGCTSGRSSSSMALLLLLLSNPSASVTTMTRASLSLNAKKGGGGTATK